VLNRNNIEYELDRIMECAEISDYDLEITITVKGMHTSTDMSVSANGEPIHTGYLADGDHVIKHKIHIKPNSKLELSMHTATHRHGQQVSLKGLRINKVDLIKSHLWIWDMFKFTHTDGRIEERNNGLYHNGTWGVTMPTPVFPWLTEERNKRSNVEYRAHLNFDIDGEDYYKLLDNVFR